MKDYTEEEWNNLTVEEQQSIIEALNAQIDELAAEQKELEKANKNIQKELAKLR